MLIYAAIALVGFVFLLVMLFVGEVGGGPSVFSTRIMASFITAFGVGGVVARSDAASARLPSG